MSPEDNNAQTESTEAAAETTETISESTEEASAEADRDPAASAVENTEPQADGDGGSPEASSETASEASA